MAADITDKVPSTQATTRCADKTPCNECKANRPCPPLLVLATLDLAERQAATDLEGDKA